MSSSPQWNDRPDQTPIQNRTRTPGTAPASLVLGGVGAGTPNSYPDQNPKDAIGATKIPMHLWPASATALGAVGLQEGAIKYGRNNWRAAPVRASVYVSALQRHIAAYMEGQDLSSDAGNYHLGNALACLAILVDAGVHHTLVDDRNYTPSGGGVEHENFMRGLTEISRRMAEAVRDHSKPPAQDWDRQTNIEERTANAKTVR